MSRLSELVKGHITGVSNNKKNMKILNGNCIVYKSNDQFVQLERFLLGVSSLMFPNYNYN